MATRKSEFMDSLTTTEDYVLPLFSTKHIKESYPEVNVYLDNMVPKVLLQKLYYRANGIDEKVLKRGMLKED